MEEGCEAVTGYGLAARSGSSVGRSPEQKPRR